MSPMADRLAIAEEHKTGEETGRGGAGPQSSHDELGTGHGFAAMRRAK